MTEELNVLQEIGLSFSQIENPELSFEDYWESSEYEGDYSYIVNEIIATDYDKDWRIKSYPLEVKWAKDNGFKFHEGETGGDGSGEYCYAIFSWKGKTYKIEFSYYSHYGNNFDDVESTIKEVRPVEKLVTVWE